MPDTAIRSLKREADLLRFSNQELGDALGEETLMAGIYTRQRIPACIRAFLVKASQLR